MNCDKSYRYFLKASMARKVDDDTGEEVLDRFDNVKLYSIKLTSEEMEVEIPEQDIAGTTANIGKPYQGSRVYKRIVKALEKEGYLKPTLIDYAEEDIYKYFGSAHDIWKADRSELLAIIGGMSGVLELLWHKEVTPDEAFSDFKVWLADRQELDNIQVIVDDGE